RSVLLASLRILYLLGFRQVYLLGVDFEMSETKRYHFDEGRTSHAIKGNMDTYAKLQQWFTELQPQFKKAGFKVFNCNPQSRLTAFPILSYEAALAASHAQIGDHTQERTEGMYSRAEEQKKAASEAAKAEGKETPSGMGPVEFAAASSPELPAGPPPELTPDPTASVVAVS
ncbi:MAG: hypothetical protein NTV80_08370, partial [Verrucomicrobia bacterium]|nr:hypothetical protein [Verrucomicrobiota bacterium]